MAMFLRTITGGGLGSLGSAVGGLFSGVVNTGKSVVSGLGQAVGSIFGMGRSVARTAGQVAGAGASALTTGLGLFSSPIVWIGGGLIAAGLVYVIATK